MDDKMFLSRNQIQQITDNNQYIRQKLFYRGFFLTNSAQIKYNEYPFYDAWNVKRLNAYYTMASHSDLPMYYEKIQGECIIGILGHAYNPITGSIDEKSIISDLGKSWKQTDLFFERINELTGVFCLFVIEDKKITFLNDTVGLQSVFYFQSGNQVYISSHSNLIGDLLDLEEDEYVTKLKMCKTFKYFGNQLPGNIAQYQGMKRLNPNHYAVYSGDVKQTRFYWPHSRNISFEEACHECIQLLQNTMELIAKKWNRPAISLTGGCDSRTTLACTRNVYDKYSYFSYDSQSNEKPDAQAAAKICEALELPHTIYEIPYEDEFFDNIEDVRKVLIWNRGNIIFNNPNDVRKRIFLDCIDSFDVEIKSWASEVGRSRYTKRYNGRRNFGKTPSPRKCTTFYKFLLFNRGLVRKTDFVFKEYLDKYFEQDKECPIPWQDQFYWEWHWPSRDGLGLTGEQQFSNEITVPYNNRHILELFLSVAEDDRINDRLYFKIRDELDARIDSAVQTVADVNRTKTRAKLENLYYVINNLLPF